MTTAGRLLRSDDLPLHAVAQRSGHSSESALAEAFKREYGVAPGQYRKGARDRVLRPGGPAAAGTPASSGSGRPH
ncbi:helix-turn-helix domain-containing protein [Streptomyces zaomyceticus]|uniref:helix-turn-helix domain-containing protein n=1 Tax=Streptomyces zaomyceticus TaxID=68286 RepID=UPI0036B260C6